MGNIQIYRVAFGFIILLQMLIFAHGFIKKFKYITAITANRFKTKKKITSWEISFI